MPASLPTNGGLWYVHNGVGSTRSLYGTPPNSGIFGDSQGNTEHGIARGTRIGKFGRTIFRVRGASPRGTATHSGNAHREKWSPSGFSTRSDIESHLRA